MAVLVVMTGCAAPQTEPSSTEGPSSPATATSAPPSPEPSPSPTFTVPLVMAMHHSRMPTDVPLEVAQQVVASGTASWADLGQPGEAATVVRGQANPRAALDQVVVDSNTLALVPASAVDEQVRVLSVGGVDPLLDPAGYQLRIDAAQAIEPTITTISIVGDIMLGRRVGEAITGDPAAPLRPFAEQLAAADVTVGNFEATLSRNGEPTQGGDSFAADPSTLAGLDLAGFDAVSLANNHVGDFGTEAMLETFTAFDDAGIAYFGAGENLDAARRPWIVEDDGVRIGFIGTESIGETPAAASETPGTNRLNMAPRTGPLDEAALERIVQDIAALDAEVDTVIVVPHWGTQYTHVPEPIQSEVAARFAEAGADLIVGGHPHWVQGWEAIGDATVVHSLGNFIFDMDFNRQVQEGIFVEVVLWDGAVKAVAPVPYVIENFIPQPATDEEAARILSDLRSTSSGPYAG